MIWLASPEPESGPNWSWCQSSGNKCRQPITLFRWQQSNPIKWKQYLNDVSVLNDELLYDEAAIQEPFAWAKVNNKTSTDRNAQMMQHGSQVRNWIKLNLTIRVAGASTDTEDDPALFRVPAGNGTLSPPIFLVSYYCYYFFTFLFHPFGFGFSWPMKMSVGRITNSWRRRRPTTRRHTWLI